MWIAINNIKVKTSLFDAKNKPIYELRHTGEPVPEAHGFSKPLLWCRWVDEDGPEAKAALAAYKQRTGRDFGAWENKPDPGESGATKKEIIEELKWIQNELPDLSFKDSDSKKDLSIKLAQAQTELKKKKEAEKAEEDGAQKESEVPQAKKDEDFDFGEDD